MSALTRSSLSRSDGEVAARRADGGVGTIAASNKAYSNARRLRQAMSLPEVLLWQVLRQRPGALKFRRQHPAGDYVLDFYLPERKLAIEIDGSAHDMGDRPGRDERRDAWLMAQGYGLLRISAKEVLTDPAAVADAIVRHCQSDR